MAVYEIRVQGHLDGHWSEWFDGLAIANLQNGEAILSGEIVDQAALHGVLNKVRDLNLALVAISSEGLQRQDPAIRPARHWSDRALAEVIGRRIDDGRMSAPIGSHTPA